MSTKLRNYKTEAGNKTVLVDDEVGRKYLYVLMMDGGLVLRKVPKSEEQYMDEVYDVKNRRGLGGVFTQFASYGHRVGSTKAARRFLKEHRP